MPRLFDFLAALLTKSRLNEAEADFVAKWQQLTPAVMAKGVEDTTFYCFDRLVSCNEVGSQASLIGISAGKFHEFCHSLSDRWPNNLLATSTHDNKRSEDVRTRISILSEIPERWAEGFASMVDAECSRLARITHRIGMRNISCTKRSSARGPSTPSAAGSTC